MRERLSSGSAVTMFGGLALLALSIFLFLALGSFEGSQVGASTPQGVNLCGKIGAHIAAILLKAWGIVAFVLPIAALGFAIALFRGYRGEYLPLRLSGLMLLIPALCGLVHLLPDSNVFLSMQRHWHLPHLHGIGGTLGHFLCAPAGLSGASAVKGGILLQHLEFAGTLLVLGLALIAAFSMMKLGLKDVILNLLYAARDRIVAPKREGSFTNLHPVTEGGSSSGGNTAIDSLQPQRPTTVDDVTRRIAVGSTTGSLDPNDLVERIRKRRRELGHDETTPPDDNTPPDPMPAAAPRGIIGAEERGSTANVEPPQRISEPVQTSAPALSGGTDIPEESPLIDDDEPEVQVVVRQRPAPVKRERRRVSTGDYSLPDIELLDDAPERNDTEHDAETADTSKLIEQVFSDFNINVKVVTATRGPVITQYEMELKDTGMRVSKVEGFEKDLQLKLGTEGIRIVAPLPNKKTVGVEVPNRLKQAVVMRDLVEEVDAEKMALPLILGRDVLGNPMVGDLAKMPHLLVAGATGMGKSVCMNAMICSILLFKQPESVKFIMVDPKMVELAGYEDIPHLLAPPITDMSKAHAALDWACKTMDERYFALRMVGVRNIIDYNKLGEDEIRKRLAKKGKDLDDLPGIDIQMSYIIILVDEYADLMMVNKEVEKSIVRLTAKSRACGIHIILTTQRPSADVVTGLIKSNLPARISFRVSDKNNSRVVLDAGGAENLLGKGDMLYLPPGSSSLVRGQGVWVKDHEIDAIIDHAKEQGEPEYDESICKPGAVAMAGGGGSGSADGSNWLHDIKFHEAVWSMYRYNKTGADFMRRKLQIGYNKATAIVEQLEDLGFVGPQKGTKSREILKSWDDWLDELKVGGVDIDPEECEWYTNPMA